MSILNFPTSPSTGDLYTFGDYTYRYDGEKWTTISLGNTAALRTDLANGSDPAKGAALVGYNGTTVAETLQGFWNMLNFVVMPWTSVDGGTLTQPNQVFLHTANGNYYSWSGSLPKVVEPNTDPVMDDDYVPRTDAVLRNELAGDNGDILIPSIYKSAGCIMASRHGVESGVDCAPIIQTLQDLSEQYKIPIDFSGISVVAFSGKIRIGEYFHWRSSGKFDTTIKPLTKSRAALGAGPYGVYAWFGPANPTVSIKHAVLEDIGFAGGYEDVGTHSPPVDRLIRAFCWHAHTGATHKDITAIRVHAVNCPHEFWEGYTTGGGKIDGIRMLFCSGDVADPKTSCVGCNFFKCMNGTIDIPGPYGTYTISNIVSFGNTCRGWRTLNDFKRGSERWSISACETIDMNDCHHSSDGSRAGTFEASNKGWQTGVSRATKNYLELQGENIDVMGFHYDADKGGSTKRGVAAILINEYEFPANGGDGVGNNARQSKFISIYSGFAKNVNHHAIRFISSYKCGAENVVASQCLLGAVAFESAVGKVDTDTSAPIVSTKNWLGSVMTEGCQYEAGVSNGSDVVLRVPPSNENNGCRVELGAAASYKTIYTPNLINAANTLVKSEDYWSNKGVTKSDYTPAPIGVPYAFELEDTSNTLLQTFDWGGKVPLSQAASEYLYISMWVLKGTSPAAALTVLEFTSAGELVSHTVKELLPTTSWGHRRFTHKPTTPSVSYVVVRLAPASYGYSDPTRTGTTRFADVRISKTPI